MPELPEVETIAKQLNKTLMGKKVFEVEVLREKSFQGKESELAGKKIKKVNRAAKMIVVEFFGWEKVVVVHLKMTGQLVWREAKQKVKSQKSKVKGKESRHERDDLHDGSQVVGGHPSKDWVEELPSSHTRVIWRFLDGSKLFFNDMRVFGWIKIVTSSEFLVLSKSLPPDVVDKEFSLKYFSDVLVGSGRAVKLVVMDSQKIGGAGNIYANDALNLAKIDPRKVARKLSEKEVKELYKAVKKVIDLGIKYGGATYSDFKDAKGLGGSYQNHFLVYKRDGEKCKNCGGEIRKIKLGGRGTYYCCECQK